MKNELMKIVENEDFKKIQHFPLIVNLEKTTLSRNTKDSEKEGGLVNR